VEKRRIPRQFVSRAELTRILTERMRELPNGKDCSLGGVLRLPRLDKDGCNWMPGVVPNACRSALREVVAKARLEFNLYEE
jgi:hypothetical protein